MNCFNRFQYPFVLALLTAGMSVHAAEPGPISEQLRKEWRLAPFYQKQIDAGVLVVGSKRVTDNALAEAAWIVERMLGNRPDIIKAMRENKVRVVVKGHFHMNLLRIDRNYNFAPRT